MATTQHLTIGTLNGHNNRTAFRRAAGHGLDVFTTNEANRPPTTRALRGLARYRYETATPKHYRGRRVELDVGVAVRRFRDDYGVLSLRISEQLDRYARVAPDRYLIAAAFGHPLARDLGHVGIAHVGVHLNAGPDAIIHGRHGRRHPIVREYEESVESLMRTIGFLRAEGFLVTGGGDVNITDRRDPHPWSPYPRLRAAGFEIHADRLDALWWDSELRLHLPVSTVSPRRIGSDHPFLKATLRARR